MEQRKRLFIRDFGFLPWTKKPSAQAVNEERRQKNIRMLNDVIDTICPVRTPVYSGPTTPACTGNSRTGKMQEYIS